MQRKRNQRGITLIALVITIIVLLILAGITINIITSQDGILNKSILAKNKMKKSKSEEEVKLAWTEVITDVSTGILKDKDITSEKLNSYLKDLKLQGKNGEEFLLEYKGNIIKASLSGNINTIGGIANKTVDNSCEISAIDVAGTTYLSNYKIYGNSKQDGTPTIESPIEIKSVGNLITDKKDDNYGKYKIQITVRGKNVLKYPYFNTTKTARGITFTDNGDGTITANGTATENAIFYIDNTYLFSALDKTKTYTLSSNYIYGKDYVLLNLYKENKYVTELGTWENGTRILDLSNYEYDRIECCIFVKSGETLNNFVFNPQIEEGDKATPYEQYKEPAIYNIYLDEPLRKVGDRADYIDLANKKVVRKVVEKIYNGTEGWTANANTDVPDGYSSFVLIDNTILPRYGNAINIKPISNMFKCHAGYVGSKNQEIWNVYKVVWNIRPIILTSRLTENSVEGWKKWLKENPVTVDCALDTQTEEDISLPNILLNEGTNKITIETEIEPSKIEINYCK